MKNKTFIFSLVFLVFFMSLISANTLTNYNAIIDDIDKADPMKMLDRMINALAELNDDDLELIELRYFEQRSFKEVAEILEITENNSKVRVFRILRKLRQIIQH